MKRFLSAVLAVPIRFHVFGSVAIVLFVAAVTAAQITDRGGFANSELRRDVMDRWGTPILQPAPSARYVASGTVFNGLDRLALAAQDVWVEARMNYRKRGLVYFSGFDFRFEGRYRIENPEPHDIDAVFVFPLQLEANRVLLSDLLFRVDGEPEALALAEETRKLVWTGRLAVGEARTFEISFRGRGLDAFTYRLDPELPARDFQLKIDVIGGLNFDYAEGVVPAQHVEAGEGRVQLSWAYPSLESGIPVGVILPSEKSWDAIIATMARRGWAPFLLLLAAASALALHRGRAIRFYEAYLVAAAYGFGFLLTAYLAAYLHFAVAFALAMVLIQTLLHLYLRRLLGGTPHGVLAGLLLALFLVPALAVVLEGHTGLIYSIEILLGLGVLMWLTTRRAFQDVIARGFVPAEKEASDATA